MGYYVETTTNITLVYNGTEAMIAKADFVITVPVISDQIKYYYNITLGAEKTSTTPAQHFFNAENGMVYSACDYETIKNDVYFYVTTYTSGATIQFNNPNNSATQTSRFSCNGVPLTGEKLPNVVKFRKLTDSGSEGDFKQKVINRTLEEINPTIVTFSTGSSVMRQTDFNVGDVLLFRKSSGTEMVGFIEITDVNISSVLGESTITFNCFFQK